MYMTRKSAVLAPRDMQRQESLTMDKVNALLREQDERWTQRFIQLEKSQKVLQTELKKAKQKKTMMVNGQDLMLFSAETDLSYCMKIVPIVVPDIYTKCFSKKPGVKARTSEREVVSIAETKLIKGYLPKFII